MITKERYIQRELIGSGAYGKVFRVYDSVTKQHLAMKRYAVLTSDREMQINALREISILRQLSHTNIVRVVDVICSSDETLLFMELMDFDLETFLAAHRVKRIPGKVTKVN